LEANTFLSLDGYSKGRSFALPLTISAAIIAELSGLRLLRRLLPAELANGSANFDRDPARAARKIGLGSPIELINPTHPTQLRS
jgi:hypothetical protein